MLRRRLVTYLRMHNGHFRPPLLHLHKQRRLFCASLYDRAVELIHMSKQDAEADNTNDSSLLEAHKYLEKAAAEGHAAAKGRLGRWKLLGIGPFAQHKPPLEDAHVDLHEAAVAEDPDAQYWLGRLWLDPSKFNRKSVASENPEEETGDDSDASVVKAIEEDLDEEDLQAYQDVDPEKKKQVLKEVRQSRRLARINRNKRARGLPEVKSLHELSSSDKDKSSLYRDIQPHRVTLHADEDRGVYWLQCAADQHNHPEASILLGNLALGKSDVMTAQARYEHAVFGKGINLLHQAIQSEKTSAASAFGDTQCRDPSALGQWIQQWIPEASSNTIVVDGLFNLGQLYWDSQSETLMQQDDELGKDEEIAPKLGSLLRQIAIGCFACSAARGDATSQFWLGQLYHWGDSERNIPHDGKIAFHYLSSAADADHGGAELYLSRLYREGSETLGIEKDRDTSVALLLRACQHEEPDALYELGTCYAEGTDRFKQNYEKAFNAFVQGAAFNHSDCLLNAGVMAYQGLGTKKDKRRAFLFYQKAGENGSLQAWSNLAAMYAFGEGGVEKNLPVARYLKEFVERMSST